MEPNFQDHFKVHSVYYTPVSAIIGRFQFTMHKWALFKHYTYKPFFPLQPKIFITRQRNYLSPFLRSGTGAIKALQIIHSIPTTLVSLFSHQPEKGNGGIL